MVHFVIGSAECQNHLEIPHPKSECTDIQGLLMGFFTFTHKQEGKFAFYKLGRMVHFVIGAAKC